MITSSHQGPTMSVTELMVELAKVEDPDLTPVITDGCDCFGPLKSVQQFEGEILLAREVE